MQVFVNLPLKSTRSVRGRRQSIYHGDYFKVARLYGPAHESNAKGEKGRSYIWADIEIDDDLRDHISVAGFNEDGTIRVQVWLNTHRRTLAPVLPDLAESETVIDVRGMP